MSRVSQLSDVAQENFLFEPEPKDSAAAIGLAAAVFVARDPEALWAPLPQTRSLGP